MKKLLECVSYKTLLDPNKNFKTVMFDKRGSFNPEALVPKLAYLRANCITEGKNQHLIHTLFYISEYQIRFRFKLNLRVLLLWVN